MWMEDCIHLKACRRIHKNLKSQIIGGMPARGCNEKCTAYQGYKILRDSIDNSFIYLPDFQEGETKTEAAFDIAENLYRDITGRDH